MRPWPVAKRNARQPNNLGDFPTDSRRHTEGKALRLLSLPVTAHHKSSQCRCDRRHNRIMKLLMLSLALATASMAQEPFQVKVTGHGQPMILIPGLSSSGEVWDTTVARYKD